MQESKQKLFLLFEPLFAYYGNCFSFFFLILFSTYFIVHRMDTKVTLSNASVSCSTAKQTSKSFHLLHNTLLHTLAMELRKDFSIIIFINYTFECFKYLIHTVDVKILMNYSTRITLNKF